MLANNQAIAVNRAATKNRCALHTHRQRSPTYRFTRAQTSTRRDGPQQETDSQNRSEFVADTALAQYSACLSATLRRRSTQHAAAGLSPAGEVTGIASRMCGALTASSQ